MGKKTDSLGDRMKQKYEAVPRTFCLGESR